MSAEAKSVKRNFNIAHRRIRPTILGEENQDNRYYRKELYNITFEAERTG